jgi:hypothetical protein
MHRRAAVVFVLAALVLLMPSCRKLSALAPTTGESLVALPLASTNSIPPEWGTLVSVTSASAYPPLVQLWLQDRDGTLRMLVLDLSTARFVNAKLIPRR